MAAIPRDLIESELFGHERGAFTGANTRASGRFEQAEGGTLFLDEIGDMPMEAQTRLLRVLQQGEYTTVGGRTPIKTDVRIVAASNKDLRILIQQGLFREDLFFRLNVVPLRLPPLRERIEDSARSDPALLRAGREGWPAAEKARCRGARATEAASLARQRPGTRKSRPPPRGALSTGCYHRLGHRRGTRASRRHHRQRCFERRRQSRRRRRGLSGVAFLRVPEWRAPAGPLSPDSQGDRGSAADRGAGRDTRQSDSRRRSSWAQPQHIAQENPRFGYPSLP